LNAFSPPLLAARAAWLPTGRCNARGGWKHRRLGHALEHRKHFQPLYPGPLRAALGNWGRETERLRMRLREKPTAALVSHSPRPAAGMDARDLAAKHPRTSTARRWARLPRRRDGG